MRNKPERKVGLNDILDALRDSAKDTELLLDIWNILGPYYRGQEDVKNLDTVRRMLARRFDFDDSE